MKNFNKPLNIIPTTITLVLLLLFVSCTDTSSPELTTTMLEGKITDVNGNILPDVVVTASLNEQILASDTTKEDGSFKLNNLPENQENVIITATHKDFSFFQKPLSEFTSKNGNITMEFGEDCCGYINLTIIDNEGVPLENVQVKLKGKHETVRVAYSDSDGNVEFGGVCPGEYWVRLALDNYKVIEEDFAIEECDSLSHTITMLLLEEEDECCEGVITFWVQNGEEEYINGAKVTIWRDGHIVATAMTEDGKVVFDGLCKGKYGVGISAENYKGMEFHVELDCDAQIELTKTLQLKEEDCCDGKVYISVKNQNSEYLNGAEVKLRKGNELIKVLYTENGQVQFEDVCEGHYNVRIYKEGYDVLEFEFGIDCHGEKEFTKILSLKHNEDECCEGVITFWVKNEDGDYIDGAKVTLWRNGQKVESVITSNGKALFDGLCKGKYGVDIISEHYKAMEFHVELDCNAQIELTKTLQSKTNDCCDGKVYISVKNQNSEYLNGAEVKLRKGNELIKVLYTENGQVQFEEVCEGHYNVRIYKEGYDVLEFEFGIDCHGEKEFTKILSLKHNEDECCEGVITFWIQNNEEEYINGAKVTLWREGHIVETVMTNDGKAIFDGLCKGKYGVGITAEHYKGMEFNIELGCNQHLEFTKTLIGL